MQNQKWMTWAILGLAVFFALSFMSLPFASWNHAESWEAMRTGIAMKNSMHGFMHESIHGSIHGGWGFGPFGLLIGVATLFFRLGLLILMLFGVFLFWQKANGSLDASQPRDKMMQSIARRPTIVITLIHILVVLEALMFLIWAPLHLGVEIPLGFVTLAEPPIRPAFNVEIVCGIALTLSAIALFTRRQWSWNALLSAHIIAFLGVLLGMTALALGRGPRTVSNDIYHNVMMLLLMTNMLLLHRQGVRPAIEPSS